MAGPENTPGPAIHHSPFSGPLFVFIFEVRVRASVFDVDKQLNTAEEPNLKQ